MARAQRRRSSLCSGRRCATVPPHIFNVFMMSFVEARRRRRQSGGRAGRIYRCTGRLACRRRIFRAPLSWRGPRRCGAAILRSTLPKTAFFGLRCNRQNTKSRQRHPSAPQATTTILHALGTFLWPQDEHFLRATRAAERLYPAT